MLNIQNRILPNLIDKLTDNAPGQRLEPLMNRVVTIEKYKDIVLRDLIGLLNSSVTINEIDLGEMEYVKESTLAYGTQSFAGMTFSNSNIRTILDEIKQAILKFERRIDPKSLKVSLSKNADGNIEHTTNHKLKISISGALRPLQKTEMILVETEIDLETGKFELVA